MTRNELHQLVDEIPEEQVGTIAELLDAYHRGDRFTIQLLTAPEDDPTPDELEALAESERDPDRRTFSAEEVRRDLGV